MPVKDSEDIEIEYRELEYRKRRRGPKPRAVRPLVTATAWLDGYIHWEEGRVVWHYNGRIVVPDGRSMATTQNALSALAQSGSQARRVVPDFEAWLDKRQWQWRLARQLAALRAADLETLVSSSRRRNPAALERLGDLLLAEAYCRGGLPFSPSHALHEAWPFSRRSLEKVASNENRTKRVRALAWTVIGSVEPQIPLPGDKILRRAARFGAEAGLPQSPVLLALCLENDPLPTQADFERLKAIERKLAPLALTSEAIRAMSLAKIPLQRILDCAETAARMEDPLPNLRYECPCTTSEEAEMRRRDAATWEVIRKQFLQSMREILGQIALRGVPSDLEAAALLLNALVSDPLTLSAGLSGRHRKPTTRRRKKALPEFESCAREAVEKVLSVFRLRLLRHQWGDAYMCISIALNVRRVLCIAETLSPAAWVERWNDWLSNTVKPQRYMVPKLLARYGMELTKRIVERDLSYSIEPCRGLDSYAVRSVLEIFDLMPSKDAPQAIYPIYRCWRRCDRGEEANECLTLLIRRLKADPKERRLDWLIAIFGSASRIGAGARVEFLDLCSSLSSIRGRVPDDKEFPLQDLCDCIVALWQIANKGKLSEAQVEARIVWLAEQMSERWSVVGDEKPDWSRLRRLVYLAAQLTDDESEFEKIVKAGWFRCGHSFGFNWSVVLRGVSVCSRYPRLRAVIAGNFADHPKRCFALLSGLGLLHWIKDSQGPLLLWRQSQEMGIENSTWCKVAELDPEFKLSITKFIAANRIQDRPEEPPPAILKILDWPLKIASEMKALSSRLETDPNLAKRYENLRLRLENEAELKSQMATEIGEALANLVRQVELNAAAFSIEQCYRIRLESLGVDLPQDRKLDGDELNAALFSADIADNRRWLRDLLRAHFEGRTDWREKIESNARWLDKVRANGVDVDVWLGANPSRFEGEQGELQILMENEPIKVLQMGNYFGTCLSLGGCNSFSSVANAVELNKRVVFARDAKNHVVARQLLAISQEGKLVGFNLYTHYNGKAATQLRAAFGNYARGLAERCNIELSDDGEVERLFVADWYDDGTQDWSELEPPHKKKK